MDAPSALAQIVGDPREPVDCLVKRCGGGCVGAIEGIPDGEAVADPDQRLLCSVVQVTLDPAPLGICGRDDAGPRGMQLLPRDRVRDGYRNELCKVDRRDSASSANSSPFVLVATITPHTRPSARMGAPTVERGPAPSVLARSITGPERPS